MRDTDLMQLALGLIPPWMVKACAFDAAARRLDIEIDFARGVIADHAAVVPGVERVGDRTVRFTHEDAETTFRAFLSIVRIVEPVSG